VHRFRFASKARPRSKPLTIRDRANFRHAPAKATHSHSGTSHPAFACTRRTTTLHRASSNHLKAIKTIQLYASGGLMKHVRRFALSILCSGLLAIPLAAQNQNSKDQNQNPQNDAGASQGGKNLSSADRDFIKKAGQGGKAEVELGKLAAEKGSREDVKKFGQRMVDDHTKANQELEQLASKKGVDVPDKLSAKDQAVKDNLEKLSGKSFDQAYMRDMVRDHTQDVKEFKQAESTAKDRDVKSFAQNTTPTLESHLKEAKQIATKTGGTSAADQKSSPDQK
jgi:putative membrane protein